MIWKKLGQAFNASGQLDWWRSHCMAPAALLIDDVKIRVFLGCWDAHGISRIGYVDVSAGEPTKVIGVSEHPVLEIGRPGTFDENGVFPGTICRFGSRIFLYYTGFQLGHKIRHFNFGGLAISDDGGNSFTRVSEAPILDRSDEGLSVRGGPSVLREDGKFKMWYAAGTDWAMIGGKMRPTYNVYYQESPDGIQTRSKGKLCLTYDRQTEHGLGRPYVIKTAGVYRMFHTRRTVDMRYSIGYAESEDGVNWLRKDEELGLAHAESGWDSEMIYFPNPVEANGNIYLFYNGNDFGGTGFGVAELVSW